MSSGPTLPAPIRLVVGPMGQSIRLLCAALSLSVLTACNAASDSPSDDQPAAPSEQTSAVPTPSAPVTLNADLRAELVAMLQRDQDQRVGSGSDETDAERTARLGAIIDEYGWPGYDLVGKKGEEAAWAIAQHSDLDPAFQTEALELLRGAVEAGQASPGNLAYLEDRVAVAAGEPQSYGTQVACGPKGPRPTTPIRERAALAERRAAAGIEPYRDYLAEMTRICASDG